MRNWHGIASIALVRTLTHTPLTADDKPATDSATLQQILEERRQRRDDRDTQKKEIEELRAMVETLSRELAAEKKGASATPAETGPAVAETAPEVKPAKGQIAKVDPHGSLRVVVGSDTEGNTAMRDNISRVGIRGSAEVRAGLDVVATAEVGLNLWERERETIFGGDPGAPVGQVDNAVFTRARIARHRFRGRDGRDRRAQDRLHR